MATLIPARRVTIVTDSSLERILLEELIKLGVKGHTSVHVIGKGRHMLVEDVTTGRSGVRCEMIVTPEVAEAIVDYVHHDRFHAYPLKCWVDDTWVDDRDTF